MLHPTKQKSTTTYFVNCAVPDSSSYLVKGKKLLQSHRIQGASQERIKAAEGTGDGARSGPGHKIKSLRNVLDGDSADPKPAIINFGKLANESMPFAFNNENGQSQSEVTPFSQPSSRHPFYSK